MVAKITAPYVNARVDEIDDDLKNHITKHKDVYDPMLKNHDVVLFGEKHDDGICSDIGKIKDGYGTMKGIGIAILIALIANFIMYYIK
jgi:hypothetical protein